MELIFLQGVKISLKTKNFINRHKICFHTLAAETAKGNTEFLILKYSNTFLQELKEKPSGENLKDNILEEICYLCQLFIFSCPLCFTRTSFQVTRTDD